MHEWIDAIKGNMYKFVSDSKELNKKIKQKVLITVEVAALHGFICDYS